MIEEVHDLQQPNSTLICLNKYSLSHEQPLTTDINVTVVYSNNIDARSLSGFRTLVILLPSSFTCRS